MTTVLVCVGSSCHLKGARDVVKRFSELIVRHGVQEVVELRGSFCMERCGEGFNWQVDQEALTSQSVDEALTLFREKVLIRHGVAEGTETEPI